MPPRKRGAAATNGRSKPAASTAAPAASTSRSRAAPGSRDTSPASSASTEPLADARPAPKTRQRQSAATTRNNTTASTRSRAAPAKRRKVDSDDDVEEETEEVDSDAAKALPKSYGGLSAKPSPAARNGSRLQPLTAARSPSESSLSSAGSSDNERPKASGSRTAADAQPTAEDESEDEASVAPTPTDPVNGNTAAEADSSAELQQPSGVDTSRAASTSADDGPAPIEAPPGDDAHDQHPALDALQAAVDDAVDAQADEAEQEDAAVEEDAMEVDAPALVDAPADAASEEEFGDDDAYTEEVHADTEPTDAGFLRRRAEAIEHLTRIEIEFARLRDRLFVERMEANVHERDALRTGTHLDLVQLNSLLDKRRESKLAFANRQFEVASEDAALRYAAAERSAWMWWNEERATMRRDMFQDLQRAKGRLVRDNKRRTDFSQLVQAGPEKELAIQLDFEHRKKLGQRHPAADLEGDLAELAWAPRKPAIVADHAEPAFVQYDLEAMGLRSTTGNVRAPEINGFPPAPFSAMASSSRPPAPPRLAMSATAVPHSAANAHHLHYGPAMSAPPTQQHHHHHHVQPPTWSEEPVAPLRHRHAAHISPGLPSATRPSLDAHMAASALRDPVTAPRPPNMLMQPRSFEAPAPPTLVPAAGAR